MDTVTAEFLKKHGACINGFQWFIENCSDMPVKEQMQKLLNHRADWANWLIARVLPLKQKRMYAVFAAEQVIELYEEQHPNDDRPRKAIEAAKAVIENDTKENRAAARVAARAAARAAYAAGRVAYATVRVVYAAYAAYAAGRAAANATGRATGRAAANAAARAAYAADRAAYAADRAAALKKIIEYGISLL